MKSKQLLPAILVVAGLCQSIHAQGATLWTRTYGGSGSDYGYSVQQTVGGGFVVAGYTDSFGAGGRDVYLIRTDEAGDTLWTRTYGGSGSYDGGLSIQQTSDGGYVVIGRTSLSGTGNSDIWLLRLGTDGTSPILGDTKIAFGSNRDGNYEIYVMNTELTASGAGGTVIAAWEVSR
ncbi:MAG: hypothetical protein IIA60_12170 [Candidatus Marinimicrobia bacterium]|nr:hypothetical protein [Candidatus Neomarinimicrobiota bacterium]